MSDGVPYPRQGWHEPHEPKMKTCPRCSGTGVEDESAECPECQGTGEIEVDEQDEAEARADEAYDRYMDNLNERDWQ